MKNLPTVRSDLGLKTVVEAFSKISTSFKIQKQYPDLRDKKKSSKVSMKNSRILTSSTGTN